MKQGALVTGVTYPTTEITAEKPDAGPLLGIGYSIALVVLAVFLCGIGAITAFGAHLLGAIAGT